MNPLITRRSALIGGLSLLAAPAIVRAASLMPVVARPTPIEAESVWVSPDGFANRNFFLVPGGEWRIGRGDLIDLNGRTYRVSVGGKYVIEVEQTRPVVTPALRSPKYVVTRTPDDRAVGFRYPDWCITPIIRRST